MAKAPMAKSTRYRSSETARREATWASVCDHQHGKSNSQAPIGRSKRPSRR